MAFDCTGKTFALGSSDYINNFTGSENIDRNSVADILFRYGWQAKFPDKLYRFDIGFSKMPFLWF